MMRSLFISMFLWLAFTPGVTAQRYLTEQFAQVDSLVDVRYGTAVNYKDETQPLLFDLYTPHGDDHVNRPLVIYAHGGGFAGGTRKWPSIRKMSEALARKGFVVASISYRVDPNFSFLKSDSNKRAMTDAMFDMKAAIRFFKANGKLYGIDTSRIFIGGESAGAATAMMAGYIGRPQELESYPKTARADVEGRSGTPGFSSDVSGVMCLCGMMTDVSAIDGPPEPPLLWVHGSADPMVPASWALKVTEQADEVGLPYEKVLFDGATHCPWYYGLNDWEKYLDSLTAYMSHFMFPIVTGAQAPAIKKAPAKFKVANLLQSGMVIQQNKPLKIWGSSSAGDNINVQVSWSNEQLKAVADRSGQWLVTVDVPAATPGKFEPVSITASNKDQTIRLDDVLIGEVWLCAGQSNMDMKMAPIKGWYGGITNYEEELQKADYPAMRVFTEEINFSVLPQGETRGKWQTCTPKSAAHFSAVAYFFGQYLFEKMNVPVGLVVAAAAGASAQAFVPGQTLQDDTLLKRLYWAPFENFAVDQAKVDSAEFFAKVTKPGLLYNGMIHPLQNFPVRGFIYYQGESNYNEGMNYTHLLKHLIKSWRSDFSGADLPFYFTQIAPYVKNENKCENILGLFWQAQIKATEMPNTGMAFTMDVGETENIHPLNKKPVGQRLARLALHRTYGYKDVADEGPVFSGFKVRRKGVVRVSFEDSSIGTGLTTNDGQPPKFFSIAGRDGKFYKAEARISGRHVLLRSAHVPSPVNVRYALTNDAITNFCNNELLPAVPFRTDQQELCSTNQNHKQ